MSVPKLLSPAELEARLRLFPAWAAKALDAQDGRLERELKFESFERAFAFLTGLALAAQRLNHHPEIFNVYTTVRLTLRTHDAGGITALDFELAAAAEALLRAH